MEFKQNKEQYPLSEGYLPTEENLETVWKRVQYNSLDPRATEFIEDLVEPEELW